MDEQFKKGVDFFNEKKYQEALDSFLDAHVADAEYPELSYYLGLCYTHLEKFDEALLYLEQVVTSDIGLLHIYQSRMLLGYIYSVTERFRLAEFEFEKLLQDGYESAMVYGAFAYTCYKQNNIEKSIGLLESALKLEPDNPNILNSLGFILADQDLHLDFALEYCKKALSHNPSNPAYQDSLGWVLFKRGLLEEAIVALKKAVNNFPDNEEIQEHLRTILEKL